jgi:5-methyltetrahydropteroyltriglutamate--homocysteine methyltransferase
MKLLHTFKQYGYSNQIGPGVYDIHSPRVPPGQEIEERLKAMLAILPSSLLFVNPDCGLKTRGWKETEGKMFVLLPLAVILISFCAASLTNLVSAAKWARENYA